MIKFFQKIIIFSLILTVPINIFLYLWASNTAKIFYNLDKYILTVPQGDRLKAASETAFYNLKYQLYPIFGIEKKTDVNLIIQTKNINNLNNNLPKSGANYQEDAFLIIDKTIIKGKAKYRGDNYYHWAFPRKSWRFKTGKNKTFKNMRKLNFVFPKNEVLISDLLAYRLAAELNLLAPESKLVEFSVNGNYKGPRIMVEQLDENFLRKNRLMPGDIYKGDNIGQKYYFGTEAELFNNASIWEKHSYNNHYDEDNKYPLEIMLEDLSHNRFPMMAMDKFAALSVFIDLIESYHMDDKHNWVLSYDSYLEKIIPIVWDPSAWESKKIGESDFNIISSVLFESLYQNYDFLREKQSVLNNFYLNNLQRYNQSKTKLISQAKETIIQNEYSFTLGRRLLNKEESLNTLTEFNQYISKRFEKFEEYFLGKVNKQDYKYSITNNGIRLSVSGSKYITGILIKLTDITNLEDINISYKQSGVKQTNNLFNIVEINNNEILLPIKLLPHVKIIDTREGSKVTYQEATYDLDLIGINQNGIKDILFLFDNLSQETLQIEKVNNIEQIEFNEHLQNIIAKSTLFKTQKWSGKKYFSGFTLIKDNLIIEKGTQIFLEEGATIKVLGKVTAIGTKEQPIMFQALDNTRPWGSFVLKDERSNGSRLKHVVFKDGSGDKGELYEYTAMLSVHNVKDLTIENCEFIDSKITDDMVHVVYSNVKFIDSKFVRAKADALDADISNIVVENCEFINAGNDSIDLMTTNAVVINSKLSSSKDKGLSVGEGSSLLAINNIIENNEIGIQSKDNSQAYVFRSTFIANTKAVDAYHKNWRYSDGGLIKLDGCMMDKNNKIATVGKKSKIILNNCIIEIEKEHQFNSNDIANGKLVISHNEDLEINLNQTFFEKYHHLIKKEN